MALSVASFALIQCGQKLHTTTPGPSQRPITVLVDPQVSHYFKRRKIFPTQEIKEERPDGSLIVSFWMGRYEAIENILKSWIPHIVILAPEGFRKDFLQDVKGWVKRQDGGRFGDGIGRHLMRK